MQLHFLAIETGKDGCPTLYRTDRGYVVQGWRVNDPASIPGLNLIEGETCVEVPKRLMMSLDIPSDLHASSLRADMATERGTYVIRGSEITDADTLAKMDVPSHETAVEVPMERLADLAREIT